MEEEKALDEEFSELERLSDNESDKFTPTEQAAIEHALQARREAAPAEEDSSEYDLGSEAEEDALKKLDALFTEHNHNDPFTPSHDNLPPKVISAYRAIRDIRIDEIVEYMKKHPEKAEVLLKKQIGTSLPGMRNFRKEIGQTPTLLIYLYKEAEKNPTLMHAINSSKILESLHIDTLKLNAHAETSSKEKLQAIVDARRQQITDKINSLFTQRNHNDPFTPSHDNLPHKVISAYRTVRDLPIEEIFEYMKANPEKAGAFLKKQMGTTLPGIRNFADEFRHKSNLLIELFNLSQKNDYVKAATDRVNLFKFESQNTQTTALLEALRPYPIHPLRKELAKLHYRDSIYIQNKKGSSRDKKLNHYERQEEIFRNMGFHKIANWYKQKKNALFKTIYELEMTIDTTKAEQTSSEQHSNELHESHSKKTEDSKGKSEEDAPLTHKKPVIRDEILKYAEELKDKRTHQELTDLKRDNPLMEDPLGKIAKKELKKEAKIEAKDLRRGNPLMKRFGKK